MSWDLCRAAPPRVLDGPVVHGSDTGAVARVFPLWPDLVLHAAFRDVRYDDVEFGVGLSRMGGTFGLPSHDYLLGTMSRSDERRRKESGEALVELLQHDRLDPALAAEAALGRHAAGTLALPTSVQSWDQVMAGGGLRGLWPLALAIASALSGVSPRPAGLPALLRLLTSYAHEVPEPVVPEGIRDLAESRGSSRSHVEARALVAALTNPRAGR